MKCQRCQQREAQIYLNVQLNHQQQKLHICQTCYVQLRNQAGAGLGKNSLSSMNDLFKSFGLSPMNMKGNSSVAAPSASVEQAGGILDELGNNLTDRAKAGLIDPVIGREEEIERVIEVLNRRNKNNPVLIGEPGVGKTAIAEGLALQIVEGNVPSKLIGKIVYTLDVASLVAGTGIRGQFEEKMKEVINELQARQDVILFIDELHLLVGAGKAEGSMDAGNILKPALARGELQVVGATTLDEYRQIEKDGALERRFQPVIVSEPTIDETVEILKGLRSRYEDYHQVSYSDDVLRACVELSDRYIQDRFLPDKAIDLVDEAGSKLNLQVVKPNSDETRIKLNAVIKEKEAAIEQEDFEKAARLRDEETRLLDNLNQTDVETPKAAVQIEHIQDLIERKTGIPVKKLQQDEQSKMKNLAESLGGKVIGQMEAVDHVARAIRRSRAGFKPKHRPIASFLFIGPTGVGKTELSKSLAVELFGSKDAMIRLDMSEYMEKHSVSKLIGSPPGYIGHEEAGQLTEQVRRNPYSIILLDEIEKAHPDVQNMFLQILDDGRLTDSQGRTVNFKETVIIATSNAGSSERQVTVGFGADEEQNQTFISSLDRYFRPEFLNRFDGIIRFRHLDQEDLVEIVDIMLKEVMANMKQQNIACQITQRAKEKLAELGYDPRFGARPLRRAIQQHIEDSVTDLILDQDNVQSIEIDVINDQLQVKKIE
ncbi:ATP-dependent Clp protease ATP-binding subunit [Ammoniphilus oxalaticus]|uniref:ATP-dependent Clp protease ATP-binding subunit n=1 Tax=Ammoniphilus oxalaticus TaxID=66863 RepID=A0A419SLY3_9BACL|nr:ATP-dependent Clp protease ATP-binding subunit [Ammoniphilus oxalaticus]RKD25025.1 ATP-dependent Clp protease ATP-binding subunit [Ammoniphilus oxalaticus]